MWVAQTDTNSREHGHSGEASGCSRSQEVTRSLWRSKVQQSSTTQHQWSQS